MTLVPAGPASQLGRRFPGLVPSRPAVRPYADAGCDPRDIALAATRALLRSEDAETVRRVVATAVGDLGGALVPARFEPVDALGLDVSLGLGEPVLVVVDPLSVAALGLRQVVPALVHDARSAVQRLTAIASAPPVTEGHGHLVPDDARARFMASLERADHLSAQALVLALLHAGAGPATVVEQVLAPALREVGERWYRHEWTLADEHAATTVVDRCLAHLPPDTTGPRLLIASPEGEWHAMPARLLAVAARGTWAAALPAGLPAEDLRRHLETTQPAALVLSCTLATNLLGAAASIAAAHAAGVPVIAGGQAFGRDGHRAQRLGADAWASSAASLAAHVPELSADAPGAPPHESVVADAVTDDLLALALERQAAESDWVRTLDQVRRDHALADLRRLTQHAAAALACDDPSVLGDHLAWLTGLLRHREVPAHVLPDGARYVADLLEPSTPRVAELLHRGVEAAG